MPSEAVIAASYTEPMRRLALTIARPIATATLLEEPDLRDAFLEAGDNAWPMLCAMSEDRAAGAEIIHEVNRHLEGALTYAERLLNAANALHGDGTVPAEDPDALAIVACAMHAHLWSKMVSEGGGQS